MSSEKAILLALFFLFVPFSFTDSKPGAGPFTLGLFSRLCGVRIRRENFRSLCTPRARSPPRREHNSASKSSGSFWAASESRGKKSFFSRRRKSTTTQRPCGLRGLRQFLPGFRLSKSRRQMIGNEAVELLQSQRLRAARFCSPSGPPYAARP